MGYFASKEEQKRFTEFTKKLTNLSKEYGIVLAVTGGVAFYSLKNKKDKKILEDLAYTDDATSGDLNPLYFYSD